MSWGPFSLDFIFMSSNPKDMDKLRAFVVQYQMKGLKYLGENEEIKALLEADDCPIPSDPKDINDWL